MSILGCGGQNAEVGIHFPRQRLSIAPFWWENLAPIEPGFSVTRLFLLPNPIDGNASLFRDSVTRKLSTSSRKCKARRSSQQKTFIKEVLDLGERMRKAVKTGVLVSMRSSTVVHETAIGTYPRASFHGQTLCFPPSLSQSECLGFVAGDHNSQLATSAVAPSVKGFLCREGPVILFPT